MVIKLSNLMKTFQQAGCGGMDDVQHNTDTVNPLFCGEQQIS
jgi:hypothetical protein